MKHAATAGPIQRAEESVQQWKENGGGVVGYTCSFLPVEVLNAANVLPARLRGTGVSQADIGDTYFGPYICSYPKCILQRAGSGQFSYLDGLIIVPGCDSMRRLDECWRKAGEDFQGIVPDFFFHFGVPHKAADHSKAWFSSEIERLMRSLEEHFGARIGEDDLRQSIARYNRGREMIARLNDFRKASVNTLSGEEAFALSVAGTLMPRDEYNQYLGEYMDEVSGRKPGLYNGKTRLMVAGSVSDDLQLISMAESLGGVVAAETLCFGQRHEGDRIDEDEDPVSAMVCHYLDESLCPRMLGGYQARLMSLKEKIEEMEIDGVIFQNIRFCDLHGSENAIFERDLEAMGIPCVRIEREYGALADTGRLRMRLEAFMERMT